jgi:hypothetical protein
MQGMRKTVAVVVASINGLFCFLVWLSVAAPLWRDGGWALAALLIVVPLGLIGTLGAAVGTYVVVDAAKPKQKGVQTNLSWEDEVERQTLDAVAARRQREDVPEHLAYDHLLFYEEAAKILRSKIQQNEIADLPVSPPPRI